jgi:hypothetical protein
MSPSAIRGRPPLSPPTGPGGATAAFCEEVWIVSVTGVVPLPAGMVCGVKVAVAPAGSPETVKLTGSRKVVPPVGLTLNV